MTGFCPLNERSPHPERVLLLDWGDTLMRNFPQFSGPMATWPEVALMPYVIETLAALRSQWLLCLATNAADSSPGDIWEALRRVSLDELLNRVYCLENVGARKPEGRFFEHILADLNLEPGQAVMVGDDFEVDVLGATQWGLGGVWVNTRTDEVRQGSGYRTVTDFRHLPLVLSEMVPKSG